MKKYSSGSYLISCFILLSVAIFSSAPAWPLFIKWLVPFPRLEQAVIYEGILQYKVQLETLNNRSRVTDYYIADKTGKHKVFWGIRGAEDDRFMGKELFNGLKAKVWFHPIFGVIQEEFIVTPTLSEHIPNLKGQSKFGNSYNHGTYDVFMNHFNYDRYAANALPTFICLLFSILAFIKFKVVKRQENELLRM